MKPPFDPRKFVCQFSSMDEFGVWCECASSINDLRYMLKEFEKAELYEYCSEIQKEIDYRVDIMLSGFGIDP